MNFIHELVTERPFNEVVANIERQTAEHKFRVLAVHDVQATLREKGLEREETKIIEVCNAGFAHTALQKDTRTAIFMPCRYSVHRENGKTIVRLGRPTMIAQMMPDSGLTELAAGVEETLKRIMTESV
jgi:uncharacterized protein (DUF302 family)